MMPTIERGGSVCTKNAPVLVASTVLKVGIRARGCGSTTGRSRVAQVGASPDHLTGVLMLLLVRSQWLIGSMEVSGTEAATRVRQPRPFLADLTGQGKAIARFREAS